MVSRPIVVIDPAAAALRRLCMGDLEVPGGLVEPGEDPGVPEPPATTLAGLRREAAFAGCRVSGDLVPALPPPPLTSCIASATPR